MNPIDESLQDALYKVYVKAALVTLEEVERALLVYNRELAKPIQRTGILAALNVIRGVQTKVKAWRKP